MRHAYDKAITYATAGVIVVTVLLPWAWCEFRKSREREASWQEVTA